MLTATLVFWKTNLDLYLEKFFYDPPRGWYLRNHPLLQKLYNYGRVPGAVIFVISFIIYILSFFMSVLAPYRDTALFLFLFMFIGAGILVNSIFKIYWERPRPKQVLQLGGEHNFVNVGRFGDGGRNSSFPCGHASIGFYLIFPYFLFKSSRPLLALLFLFLGIMYGLILGLARMIQGGHFASDVLWALGVMYFTGLALSQWLEPGL